MDERIREERTRILPYSQFLIAGRGCIPSGMKRIGLKVGVGVDGLDVGQL